MAELPTVRIVDPKGNGYRIINQQDFDPTKHRLYAEPAAEPPVVEPSVPPAETPDVPVRPFESRRRGRS